MVSKMFTTRTTTALVVAALSAVLLVAGSRAAGLSSIGDLPGMPWRAGDGATLAGAETEGAATHDGRTLRVTSVYGDPEQTLVAYAINSASGETGAVGDNARLVLADGQVVDTRWNATEGAPAGTGTLVFPGLPEGVTGATLELDQLNFPDRAIRARFAIAITVDNRAHFAQSARSDVAVTSGEGKSRVTITSVARTPSVIVVRGSFDGLSEAEIQALSSRDIALLLPGGERLPSESGRLGFGEGLRSFEFRFPAGFEGLAALEVTVAGAGVVEAAVAVP